MSITIHVCGWPFAPVYFYGHNPLLKLFCILIIVLLATFKQSSGQDIPKIISPSPDVSAITKYGEIPVNLYNGVPDINIPLYEVRQRDISLPITLSYHASGIKVSEEASWVGLGWSLHAGGVIGRSVVNEDDLEGSYLDSTISDVTDLSSLTSNTSSPFIYFGCNAAANGIDFCNLLGRHTSPVDFEPDMFSYSYPGGSGKFILNRAGEPVLARQEKLEMLYNSVSKIWTLRDAKGFTYSYEKYETEREQGDSREVVTAWYLTKIESPLGHSITLHYVQDVDYNLYTIGNIAETRSISVSKGVQPAISLPTQKTYRRWTLESIDFSHGLIKFQSNTQRDDLKGGRKLYQIEVYEKNEAGQLVATPIKTFELGFDYFIGNTDNIALHPYVQQQSFLTHRLKLISLTEKAGSESKPSYYFEYFDSDLPGKASLSQDYWGYHNEGYTSTLVPQITTVLDFGIDANHYYSQVDLTGHDRGVSTIHAKAFTLKRIQYPTGGSSEFEYECNEYDHDLSGINATGSSTPLQYVNEHINVHGITGQTTITELDLTDAYVNPGDGKVHFTANMNFRCHHLTNGCQDVAANNYDAYFELHSNSTATSPYMNGGSNPRVDFTDATFCYNDEPVCYRGPFQYTVEPGVYYVKAHWNTNVDLMGMTASYTWLVEDEPDIGEDDDGLAGGLRIATITNKDADGHSYIRRFEYSYLEDRDEDGDPERYSYGRLMDHPHHIRYQIDYDWLLVISGLQQLPQYVTFVQSSSSNVPLAGHGIIVGYDQVTELLCKNAQDETGEFGKTVYKYYNRIAPVAFDDSRLPGTPNPNINSNGLLWIRTDYHFNGADHVPVKETVNTYEFDDINYDDPPEYGPHSQIIYGVKRRVPAYQNIVCEPFIPCPPGPGNGLVELYFYPSIHSEWLRLVSTTEKEFDMSRPNELLTKTTTYEYESSPVHFQTKKTINNTSDNHLLVTEFTYPADPTSGAMAEMWNPAQPGYQHMHALPVKQITYRDGQPVNRTENDYGQVATSSTGKPIIALTANESFPTGSEEGRLLEYSYNSDANIIATSLENDVRISYLWGYRGELPIAQVTNADPEKIAFTSFEMDGQHGQWNITSPNYSNTQGRTGKRCLDGGSALSNVLTGSYVISLWAKDAVPSVSGSTPVVTHTDNLWTYYEWHVVLSNNAATIQTNGAKVDDMRLYPAGSLMTSFTYDPMAGMTSSTDANNTTTYFEYDSFGRLEAVRDHWGNVVKGYSYHYRTQP